MFTTTNRTLSDYQITLDAGHTLRLPAQIAVVRVAAGGAWISDGTEERVLSAGDVLSNCSIGAVVTAVGRAPLVLDVQNR